MKSERVFDLDERLINFASSILGLSDRLPQTLAGRHMAGQLIRGGTAPALHYGSTSSGIKEGFYSQDEGCTQGTQGNL